MLFFFDIAEVCATRRKEVGGLVLRTEITFNTLYDKARPLLSKQPGRICFFVESVLFILAPEHGEVYVTIRVGLQVDEQGVSRAHCAIQVVVKRGVVQ